jgi:tryptophan synthase alpha chain
MIGDITDSFIYYVSLTGITGARDRLPWEELEAKVKEIKEITKKPVAVGFGVSKREHTEKLSKIADGVIVGSAIVKLQGEGDFDRLKSIVRELKEGLI